MSLFVAVILDNLELDEEAKVYFILPHYFPTKTNFGICQLTFVLSLLNFTAQIFYNVR